MSLLSACTGSTTQHEKQVLPENGPNMSDIFHRFSEDNTKESDLNYTRATLLKTTQADIQTHFNKSNEVNSFYHSIPKQLLNPVIQIYVYPHFDQSHLAYIPAHLAYTFLYQKAHFALLGEVSG